MSPDKAFKCNATTPYDSPKANLSSNYWNLYKITPNGGTLLGAGRGFAPPRFSENFFEYNRHFIYLFIISAQ